MKKGENNVYKMIKLQERKISDFNQVKYIKNEFNNLLMKDVIKKRCKKKTLLTSYLMKRVRKS
jgi:hypothetical protein